MDRELGSNSSEGGGQKGTGGVGSSLPWNEVSESRTCPTEGDALHPTFSRPRINGSRLPDGEEQANGQGKQALRCVWGPLSVGENRGTKPGI